jgi:hypothetical protein
MLRIFTDPALASTGFFAIRETPGYMIDVCFQNPKVVHKAQPKLSGKFVLAKLMTDRIREAYELIWREGEEVEVYIEAPFVGSFGSTVELVGLSFLLLDETLKLFASKKTPNPRLFMISASMVSGKDKKAKRERKQRKWFAVEEWRKWAQDNPTSTFGVNVLTSGSKDDVATAFLFWYYLFGPGRPPKAKDYPVLDPVQFDYDLLRFSDKSLSQESVD